MRFFQGTSAGGEIVHQGFWGGFAALILPRPCHDFQIFDGVYPKGSCTLLRGFHASHDAVQALTLAPLTDDSAELHQPSCGHPDSGFPVVPHSDQLRWTENWRETESPLCRGFSRGVSDFVQDRLQVNPQVSPHGNPVAGAVQPHGLPVLNRDDHGSCDLRGGDTIRSGFDPNVAGVYSEWFWHRFRALSAGENYHRVTRGFPLPHANNFRCFIHHPTPSSEGVGQRRISVHRSNGRHELSGSRNVRSFVHVRSHFPISQLPS